MNDLIASAKSENSLQEFYYVFFRHKKKMTWVFLSVLAIVALVTLLMPRTYRSSAKLLVKVGRETASLDPTATVSGHIMQVNQSRESEIKSEMEILKSRDLAEKVVDKLGPATILRKSIFSFFGSRKNMKADAVNEIMQNWEIWNDKDSNIINIAYQAKSPKVAHDIVATLIQAYLAKHLEVNRTPGSYAFFKGQTQKTETELSDVERRLAEAKNKTGLVSLDTRRRIIQERSGNFQRQLDETRADLQVSQAKIATFKEQLAKLPATIVTNDTTGFPNAAADSMRAKLYELQLKEQELLSKYTDNNFLVQETKRQISNASALLNRETRSRSQVTKGVNTAYEQAKQALVAETANYAGLQSKTKELMATMTGVKGELRDFNTNEGLITQLQRQRDILDASYRDYSKKMEQARIDSALEFDKISNISVAQAATYPIRHTKPYTSVNLALGFLLGALGAMGLAYYTESIDHTFKRVEDVETKLQLPILTAIPAMPGHEEVSSHSLEHLPLPVCGLLDRAEKCFEILGHRLQAAVGEAREYPQIVGVISCNSGEGVSTVATNLAESLAGRSNQRVLFVEANLVTPSAHMNFGIQRAPGLTEYIAAENDFSASVQSSTRSKLEVIPSGQRGLTVTQLADSKAFPEMLKILKTEYSHVVVDLPPVFRSISGLRLASQTDGVILVVEAERVRWEEVQEAKKLLEQAHAKIIGVVLNKQKYHIPEWLRNLTL